MTLANCVVAGIASRMLFGQGHVLYDMHDACLLFGSLEHSKRDANIRRAPKAIINGARRTVHSMHYAAVGSFSLFHPTSYA